MNAENTEKMTDEQLTIQVQKGNSRAMGELYCRYYPLVFNKCLSFAKNSEDARDLSQDVMIRVFEKLDSFKGKAKFSTWLYAITFNHCSDQMRKAKGKYFVAIDMQFDLVDHAQDSLNEAIELGRKEKLAVLALANIEMEDQELLLMKYQYNKSIQDLQAIYDLSASAVKMRLLRAKAKAVNAYNQIMPQVAA